MKKFIIPLSLVLLTAFQTNGQTVIYHYSGGIPVAERQANGVESIYINGASLTYNLQDGTAAHETLAATDSITFSSATVVVTYNGTQASVINPLSTVSVSIDGAGVTLTNTTAEEITIVLQGSSTNGFFKLYSEKKTRVVLNALNLTNTRGPAFNCQSGKKTTIVLEGASDLCDAPQYDASPEDQKATIFSEGQIAFCGTGSLNVRGLNKHAICSDDYVEVAGGVINVLSAVSDGIHTNDYYLQTGGRVSVAQVGGDGIDADDKGYITIEGGALSVEVTQDSQKALKTKAGITIRGGKLDITASGGVTVTNGDPSYCTAIKCATYTQEAGEVTIKSTGKSGKGVSASSAVDIYGGTLNISVSGDGATYTNASNTTDAYNATCVKSDGSVTITGGNITSASGLGGKCISVDGDAVFGELTKQNDSAAGNAELNASLVFNAKTTGAKFTVAPGWNGGAGINWGPGGGRPGGPGGPGGGPMNDNADYCNPKAVKADGSIIINSGTYTMSCAQDGGEGFESKTTLTVNGGVIDINTVDDCINAANDITVNGGHIYCYASNNDGIDSNGTFHFNGGVTISNGARQPEESFDCDNNAFVITGGIMIGIGVSVSNPTQATQAYVIQTNMSLTNGKYIKLDDADGNEILSYKLPKSLSGATVFLSAPQINKNSKYTLHNGGTYSSGREVYKGYVIGGTYNGSETTSVTAK